MLANLLANTPPKRRFIIPEVIQSSAMDCGPAALKAILGGFGKEVNYGRLREACQTDVDGTSIDTLEDIAVQLGLDAVQVMLPPDHLLLPEAQSLPALVVTKMPNGLTHFVVVWRLHDNWVQVMDPSGGRRWFPCSRLQEELYIHQQAIPLAMWRQWMESASFCVPLLARIQHLGLTPQSAEALLKTALIDLTWKGISSLDAATRMVQVITSVQGVQLGREAEILLNKLFIQSQIDLELIPAKYWLIHPPKEGEQEITFQGIVLLQVFGRLAVPEIGASEAEPSTSAASAHAPSSPNLNLSALLEEPEAKPWRHIFKVLRADGIWAPSVLFLSVGIAALGVTLELFLFQGLVDIAQKAQPANQLIQRLLIFLLFTITMLFLNWSMDIMTLRLGRKLEIRLRQQVLEKIPRLGDRYFSSRLISDMAQRVFEMRELRSIPRTGLRFLAFSWQIVFTAIGLIWLHPPGVWVILVTASSIIGLSFFAQPLLKEQDRRFRSYVSSLSSYYLDALLGLIPTRTHQAETVVRSEHDSFLVRWAEAGLAFFRVHVLVFVAILSISTGFTIWIFFDWLACGGTASGAFILLFWAMELPFLAQAAAESAQKYPSLRNRLLRLLEPLSAPDENQTWYQDGLEFPAEMRSNANLKTDENSAIVLHQIDVVIANRLILQNLNIQIQPGEHVAIVGASGAGKSSLVGLLLGWLRPAKGSVWVDERLLHSKHLQRIRQATAWVDPAVQLWNRSFADNLRYGNPQQTPVAETVLELAELLSILHRLPDGEKTSLGESGGLVSGGEGQRVRLGRALLRPNVRLVILDEPFRGLARAQRRELLKKARHYWQGTTLIFISHDIRETLDFPRVLVMEGGQVVEDAAPSVLSKQENSCYHALVQSENKLWHTLWSSTDWRRLWLEKGKIQEKKLDE